MRRWRGDDVPRPGDAAGVTVLIDPISGVSYSLPAASKTFRMTSEDTMSAVYELPQNAQPQSVELTISGAPGVPVGAAVIVAVSSNGRDFVDDDPTLRKAIATTTGSATTAIVLTARWRYVRILLDGKVGDFDLEVTLS